MHKLWSLISICFLVSTLLLTGSCRKTKPQVSFSSIDVIDINTTFGLTNKSNHIVSFEWDFGNGEKSTAINPLVKYTKGGAYTITLKGKDINGMFYTYQKEIWVYSSIRITGIKITKVNQTSLDTLFYYQKTNYKNTIFTIFSSAINGTFGQGDFGIDCHDYRCDKLYSILNVVKKCNIPIASHGKMQISGITKGNIVHSWDNYGFDQAWIQQDPMRTQNPCINLFPTITYGSIPALINLLKQTDGITSIENGIIKCSKSGFEFELYYVLDQSDYL